MGRQDTRSQPQLAQAGDRSLTTVGALAVLRAHRLNEHRSSFHLMEEARATQRTAPHHLLQGSRPWVARLSPLFSEPSLDFPNQVPSVPQMVESNQTAA